MADRMVKFRLITYFDEVDNPFDTEGGTVLQERTASLGQVVDITRQIDEDRLDALGALYTDDERAAIEDGSYRGMDANIVRAARAGERAQQAILPAEGESRSGVDISGMSSEEVGDYIRENSLNVQQTLDLLPEDADEDEINKLYDAENLATDNEPRKGVTDKLNAKLTAVSQAS